MTARTPCTLVRWVAVLVALVAVVTVFAPVQLCRELARALNYWWLWLRQEFGSLRAALRGDV